MNLSPHFAIEELTFSSTAQRLGIDNTPTDSVLKNLYRLASCLEVVRAILGGEPLHIDSGYRSHELNRAVGGAKTSAHLDGIAADFTCPAFGTPAEIVKAIQGSDLGYDQMILEGTWVHISFDPRMRMEILTAHFGPLGTTYTQGACL